MKIQDIVKIAEKDKYRLDFGYFKIRIFPHTLFWEGGNKLHKVSGDSGDWTLYGIAYEYNKDLFVNLEDFKDTVYDEAAALAFVKYYMPIKASLVDKSARLMYFDMAYNMGISRAVKIAQKCVGLKPDGIIGPITESKLHEVTEDCLYKERKKFYYKLARARASMNKFLKGWLNRTEDIYKR